ncbi:inositol polyphosphate kinase [Cardiosporidium cionae]|uniref:Kinase n=1 Tax=Cardiosporidium cionae TaxID=476202 RepID=A0ABQ7JB14_9APIC|nr:inositol polyphosphate kinase [Cardiosporidium cionae]|eukprot:KAF8821182.1 inositol polyphosphate kinase [Cardiosporidium cionae]
MNIESYRHQVGGHSRLVKFDDPTKVYKPLEENELRFYKKLEKLESSSSVSLPLLVLKKFIPGYHGHVEMYLHAASKDKDQQHLRQKQSNDESSGDSNSPSACTIALSTRSPSNCRNALDEWIEAKIQDKALPILSAGGHRLRYIILDDLLHNFKKPCIIDIKMGQLQRKLGATEAKERRQLEKSVTTTSNMLGFRLCGYQSYNKIHDKFCYQDKYWGRKIGKEQVLKAIRRWFWNGDKLYEDLVGELLKKLEILYDCVSMLYHYRFWSSSLLLLYDGGLNDKELRLRSLDIRMIDFANLHYLPDSSPDFEYLHGLNNLINILKSLYRTLHCNHPKTFLKYILPARLRGATRKYGSKIPAKKSGSKVISYKCHGDVLFPNITRSQPRIQMTKTRDFSRRSRGHTINSSSLGPIAAVNPASLTIRSTLAHNIPASYVCDEIIPCRDFCEQASKTEKSQCDEFLQNSNSLSRSYNSRIQLKRYATRSIHVESNKEFIFAPRCRSLNSSRQPARTTLRTSSSEENESLMFCREAFQSEEDPLPRSA